MSNSLVRGVLMLIKGIIKGLGSIMGVKTVTGISDGCSDDEMTGTA